MATGTYVFCLIASDRQPVLRRGRRGLSGQGPVRLLAVPDSGAGRRVRGGSSSQPLWLVVADAPLDEYGETAINRRLSDLEWVSRAAIAHESVVESFIECPAVLPMKLFTIFMSDVRALEQVAGDRRHIRSVLRRVTNHHEWGVRVTMNAAAAETGDPTARATKRRRGPASGAGYLSLKKATRDRAANLRAQAHTVVSELYDRMGRDASDAKRRAASELPVQGGPLLLDAAFLIPHARSRKFAAIALRETKLLAAQGFRMTVTGPWPPYSFVQS